MSFFHKQKKKSFDYNNVKAIKKIRESDKYQKNQIQIEMISKALVEHADVPQELIDELINSVQENVSMEYKAIK